MADMYSSPSDLGRNKEAIAQIEAAKAAFTGTVTKCKAYMPQKKRNPVGGR